jgi:DNA-binding CsgD family transcriptional regulator
LLQLLADGGYYKGVADELGVTEDTVRQRVGYLRRKYDAVTTVHLVATCLRRGLIV